MQHGSTWKYLEYVSAAADHHRQYLSAGSSRDHKMFVKVRKPYTGITKPYRAFIFFVVLCKFAVCIALCVFGSAWIFSSEKAGDLILNTLASVFIFEVDDIVYKGVVTKLGKAITDPERHYISFGRLETRFSNNLSSFWINVCVAAVMAVLLNYGWCQQGFRDSSATVEDW